MRETWAQLEMDYRIVYKADHLERNNGQELISWKPSIHMPRSAARIFLRVENVKTERLQDILDYDARQEGCPPCVGLSVCGGGCESCHADKPRIWYKILWDSIYSRSGYGWDVNPLVWVIDFEILQNQDLTQRLH